MKTRLAATPCGQVAEIRFVYAPGYFVELDLRPAFGAIACGKPFRADFCVAQQRQGGALVGIVFAGHPKHPSAEEQFQSPSLLVFLPEPQSLCGQLCVNPGRSVGSADDACFTARARAGVPRPPSVHESYLRPLAQELERGPSAEG